MDNGRAAEYGSPKELLAHGDGAFAAMVDETGKASAKMLRSVAEGTTTLRETRAAAADAASRSPARSAPAFNGLQVSKQIAREAREAERLLDSLARIMEDQACSCTFAMLLCRRLLRGQHHQHCARRTRAMRNVSLVCKR
jgi:hypothetical protein